MLAQGNIPSLWHRDLNPLQFAGERMYSLALRGSDKFVLRLLCYTAAAMPVPVLVMLWYIAGPVSGRSLVVLIAMLCWSALTIWFLRSVVRHRQGTTVMLNTDGVRYRAPKVGLFPERSVFIRWDRIESVEARSSQYPSLISVSSSAGSFAFDRRYAREVSVYPIQGTYLPIRAGNDLYRDLREYSGLSAGSSSARTPAVSAF